MEEFNVHQTARMIARMGITAQECVDAFKRLGKVFSYTSRQLKRSGWIKDNTRKYLLALSINKNFRSMSVGKKRY
jgi:hypothetical protein